ncbi:hypothetical protein LQZ24_04800 [Fructobacillus sp. M1-13]|uniref:NERD domain-containing protein n=1 Tax=Fructobacillus papyriferae TaxID=2713171 RepID=A0ABS5QRM2_9LACO|nr:hypothetical protein [Fructobacillus papyriferae]MBS9335572.1 hypothetical protein [Fructobacillus papyriferae]MCD2159338.1 hypothetical protein [Fructobacillus papyriferae]
MLGKEIIENIKNEMENKISNFKDELKENFLPMKMEDRVQFLNSIIQESSITPTSDFYSSKVLVEFSYFICSMPFESKQDEHVDRMKLKENLSELVNETVSYYQWLALSSSQDYFVDHLNYEYVEAEQYIEYFSYFKKELNEYIGAPWGLKFIKTVIASCVTFRFVEDEVFPDFLTLGVPISQLELLFPGIKDMMFSSEEFYTYCSNVEYPGDIDSVLLLKPIPLIVNNDVVFMPASTNIVDYVFNGLRRFFKGNNKKRQKFDHKHERYFSEIINNETLKNSSSNAINLIQNFYTVTNGGEHDFMLFWNEYAFVIEMKNADIKFDSASEDQPAKVLKNKYIQNIGKANRQLSSALIDLKEKRKYYLNQNCEGDGQLIPSNIKKFNKLIVTGKNVQSLAHEQKKYQEEEQLNVVMSMFDFQVIFSWILVHRTPEFFNDYINWRSDSDTLNGIEEMSMDEIGLFHYYVENGGIIRPGAKIVISDNDGGQILEWYKQANSVEKILEPFNFNALFVNEIISDFDEIK